jgi:hypothetical protein
VREMHKLVALVDYETLVAGILKRKEYHYPNLDDVKVAGIVENPTVAENGDIEVVFPEEFGGKIKMNVINFEFIVFPGSIFQKF